MLAHRVPPRDHDAHFAQDCVEDWDRDPSDLLLRVALDNRAQGSMEFTHLSVGLSKNHVFSPPRMLPLGNHDLRSARRFRLATPERSHHPSRYAPRMRQRVVVGLAVVLTAVGLGVGDWYRRNVEMNRLLEAVQGSENGLISGGDMIGDLLEEFAGVAPGPVQRKQVEEILSRLGDAASDAAADVLDSQDRVRSVSVLSWHRMISRAKARYLEHAEAWEDFLKDTARDPAKGVERRPEIDGTFRVAARALRAAVPDPHLRRYEFKRAISRIDNAQ